MFRTVTGSSLGTALPALHASLVAQPTAVAEGRPYTNAVKAHDNAQQ
ncbi:hypothetical protein [Streptomyces sp. 2A115]